MSHNNSADDDGLSSTSGTGSNSTHSLSSPLVPAALKRRSHQHHQHTAAQCAQCPGDTGLLYRGDSQGVLSNLRGEVQPEPEPENDKPVEAPSTLISRSTHKSSTHRASNGNGTSTMKASSDGLATDLSASAIDH